MEHNKNLQRSVVNMKPCHPKETQSEARTVSFRLSDCRGVPGNAGSSVEALKPDEFCQLERCEDVLRRGLATFFEVGQALLTIRVERLYRQDFSTFEVYCRERWGMGRTYAWHLTGAAERIRLLPQESKVPKPVNEFQVRPFLKLEADAFPKAWEQVIFSAKDGKITPEIVRRVVAELSPQKRKLKAFGNRTKMGRRLPKGCSVGGILVLLNEAKRMFQQGDTSKAIETIERIEWELIGM